ncbi:MAG: hypothetical protein JWR51_287 [Devosia sp.]|uniref:hypothetical protein n=1 Tax=Devosia sp. TaxID=1871048 RepID=UPI00260F22FA|nr:hypothetical protein [Devosia sp.]MDB5527184.1 hypothetical protein [Devosia sp.]
MIYALPQNNAAKIIRSIGTIAVFCLFGPSFFVAIHSGAGIPPVLEHAWELFVTLPTIVIFAAMTVLIGGFLPALATGCFCALLSPSIHSTARFLTASALIGAIATTLLVRGLSPFWTPEALRLMAEAALASLCCAVIVCTFRSRPTLTQAEMPDLAT